MPGAPTLLRNVIGYGLVAARPAAAIEGRLYYATDDEVWYRDNATTWDAIALGVSSVDGETGVVDLSGSYDALGAASAAVVSHEAALDPHPQYLTEAEGDAAYVLATEKGSALGVATLDAAGLIPTDQLPGLALTSTFVVGGQAAMLALAADTGDIAVRTDLNETYVLDGTGDPTILANWIHLLSPTDAVASVDGRAGVVTLNDLYDAAGTASSAVSTHNGVTTSVHGITNTANLVYTSDSRLTDARTPTAHATTHEPGGTDVMAVDAAANIGSLRTLGTTATSAVAGNDARLSDARMPNDAAYDALEAALYGKADTVAPFSPMIATSSRTPASGAMQCSFFRPMRDITVSSIRGVRVSAATGTVTVARVGLFTTAFVSGSTYNVTLVARSAVTAVPNTANTGFNATFDTTGGFPASYTLTAGTLYAVGIVVVTTTSAGSFLAAPSTTAGNGAAWVSIGTPYSSSTSGQTDLPTATTAVSADTNAAVWLRLEA